MTTDKQEVKRYDCTSEDSYHCRGCFTMKEQLRGDYVEWEDYEALQAECENLRKDADRYRSQLETVQGEPVAFCEDAALSIAERTFSTEVDERLASDIIQYAQRLHSLYAAPQPAEQQPDATHLIEALELAHMALIGYLPSHRNDITDAAISHCEQALAAHRKQGGES